MSDYCYFIGKSKHFRNYSNHADTYKCMYSLERIVEQYEHEFLGYPHEEHLEFIIDKARFRHTYDSMKNKKTSSKVSETDDKMLILKNIKMCFSLYKGSRNPKINFYFSSTIYLMYKVKILSFWEAELWLKSALKDN